MRYVSKKRIHTILWILCGVIFYLSTLYLFLFFESSPASSALHSIKDVLWHSVVSIFTGGYDYYPITFVGKVIGSIYILANVAFLGLVIAKLTNSIRIFHEKRRLGLTGTNFSNHIIILGWDSFAQQIVEQLLRADQKVAIIADNKEDIEKIHVIFPVKNAFACYSPMNDYSSLEKANLDEAKIVFVNTGSDSDKLIHILNIKKKYPDTMFVVILENSELHDTFISAGVTYVLSKNDIASKLVASYIFEPEVAKYTSDLIASTKDICSDYDIQQYRVTDGNPYIGTDYNTMFDDLRKKHNILCIGLSKNEGGTLRLCKLPEPTDTLKVELNDYVIVIANGKTEKVMVNIFKVNEGV